MDIIYSLENDQKYWGLILHYNFLSNQIYSLLPLP